MYASPSLKVRSAHATFLADPCLETAMFVIGDADSNSAQLVSVLESKTLVSNYNGIRPFHYLLKHDNVNTQIIELMWHQLFDELQAFNIISVNEFVASPKEINKASLLRDMINSPFTPSYIVKEIIKNFGAELYFFYVNVNEKVMDAVLSLKEHAQIWDNFCSNSMLTESQIDRLLDGTEEFYSNDPYRGDIVWSLLRLPHISLSTLEEYISGAHATAYDTKVAISNSKISSERLSELWNNRDNIESFWKNYASGLKRKFVVRSGFIDNWNATREILLDIAKETDDMALIRRIAQHRKVDKEIALSILKNSSWILFDDNLESIFEEFSVSKVELNIGEVYQCYETLDEPKIKPFYEDFMLAANSNPSSPFYNTLADYLNNILDLDIDLNDVPKSMLASLLNWGSK